MENMKESIDEPTEHEKFQSLIHRFMEYYTFRKDQLISSQKADIERYREAGEIEEALKDIFNSPLITEQHKKMLMNFRTDILKDLLTIEPLVIENMNEFMDQCYSEKHLIWNSQNEEFHQKIIDVGKKFGRPFSSYKEFRDSLSYEDEKFFRDMKAKHFIEMLDFFTGALFKSIKISRKTSDELSRFCEFSKEDEICLFCESSKEDEICRFCEFSKEMIYLLEILDPTNDRKATNDRKVFEK
jgi:hypothetical protein